MKNLNLAFIFIIIVLIFSCNSSKKSAKSEKPVSVSCLPMTLLKTDADSIRLDHFGIDSITVLGDCLEVFVSYSGGCGDADFKLFYTQMVLNSMPPQTSLILGFTDEDPCRSIVRKKLTFKLEHFKQDSETGGIWLMVNGKENKVLYKN